MKPWARSASASGPEEGSSRVVQTRHGEEVCGLATSTESTGKITGQPSSAPIRVREGIGVA